MSKARTGVVKKSICERRVFTYLILNMLEILAGIVGADTVSAN